MTDFVFNRSTVYDEPDLSLQPREIKKTLYLHQLRSLAKMIKLEDEPIVHFADNDPRVVKEDGIMSFSTSLAFLSDIPGYGKSLTMLALLALRPVREKRTLLERGVHGERFSYTVKDNDIYANKEFVRGNLIIVPNSIVNQWRSYLQNDCTYSYYVIGDRRDVPENVQDLKDIFNNHRCIILSNDMFDGLYDFKSIVFSRVIYDEIDSMEIKGATRQHLPLGYFTWFITSTVENIIYMRHPRRYVGTIFKGYPMDNTTIQNTMIVKNSEEYIKSTISIPEIVRNKYVVKDTLLSNLISDLVSEEVVTMLNAGDERSALEYLNISSSNETSIVKMLAENLTTELNNLNVERDSISRTVYRSMTYRDEALERVDEKILLCKKKIDVLNTRLADKLSSKECIICYNEFIDNRFKMITKCCNLVTCSSCLVRLMNNPCPTCRKILTRDIIYGVGKIEEVKEEKKENTEKELVTKADCLVDILEKRQYMINPLKILIFSDFDASFSQAQDVLKEKKIPCYNLSGNIEHKIKMFEEAKSTTVLFLNSQHFGAGINLTFCTDIIEWHRLPDSRRMQIIGRGQRLGRQVPLHFWQIFYENENK
jgi:SNF2 family DNA or RNA helicase